MKGMIFTELVEFVEEKFGFEVVDEMLESSLLPVKGAYTQAANYSFEELMAILSKLSQITSVTVDDLIATYARHLFGRISGLFPFIFAKFSSSLPFIAQVDTFIHPEVKKLYPDAELPRFQMISLDEKELIIDYYSSKPLASMAVGLMNGAADYFKEKIEISYVVDTQKTRFTVVLCG